MVHMLILCWYVMTCSKELLCKQHSQVHKWTDSLASQPVSTQHSTAHVKNRVLVNRDQPLSSFGPGPYWSTWQNKLLLHGNWSLLNSKGMLASEGIKGNPCQKNIRSFAMAFGNCHFNAIAHKILPGLVREACLGAAYVMCAYRLLSGLY